MKKSRTRTIIIGVVALLILAGGGIAAYVLISGSRVYVDTASISAPLIDLSPTTAGQLNAVYVNVGDTLPAGAAVALVGTEVVTTQVAGEIVAVNNIVGAQVTPGQDIVTEIDPTQLRVVGQVTENKGLSNIAVGDLVVFTVDAFSGKKFQGVIDQVSPTSNQSDIVFNISDAREEQTFDVEARFDTTTYPELNNGMSARMWIYRNTNS